MLNNNKLYLETDEFFNEPFIKEYLSDFFKSKKTRIIIKRAQSMFIRTI